MSENKSLTKFMKKFYRSMTTHLGKQVIFSTNFKNEKTIDQLSISDDSNHIPTIVFVLSSNSKMNLKDSNGIMYKMFGLRTFNDLNIQKELCANGLKITFFIEDVKHQYIIVIFKTYKFADNVLQGYETNNGMEYVWIEFVDFQLHPSLVLEKYNNDFHRVLQKKVQSNINILLNINWTKEISVYEKK